MPFGRVIAIAYEEIFIHPSDDEERRLPACTYSGRKPAATIIQKIKTLNLGSRKDLKFIDSSHRIKLHKRTDYRHRVIIISSLSHYF